MSDEHSDDHDGGENFVITAQIQLQPFFEDEDVVSKGDVKNNIKVNVRKKDYYYKSPS